MVRLHKSIPSPRSSCAPPPPPHGMPPQINPISLIQSCPHDVSQPASHPNGVPPQINPISPIQSCTPMTYPINQSHRPDPARVACPTAHPHKSIPSPWSSKCHVPLWQAPWINPITLFQPVPHTAINQPHCPAPANVACPHETIPLPRSSHCHISPWFNPIAPIQPVTCVPMARPHISILSPRSSRATPWHIPVNQPIALIQPVSYATMTHLINQSHRPIQPVSNSHSNAYKSH